MSTTWHPQQGTTTIVAGSATANLVMRNSTLRQIYVNPATGTTTYNLSLTDKFSRVVYQKESITGLHSEIPDMPVLGNMTLTIAVASADEAFDYFLALEE